MPAPGGSLPLSVRVRPVTVLACCAARRGCGLGDETDVCGLCTRESVDSNTGSANIASVRSGAARAGTSCRITARVDAEGKFTISCSTRSGVGDKLRADCGVAKAPNGKYCK